MSSFLGSPPSPEQTATWCQTHLGAPPVEVLFETRCLSFVTGLRLADAREVVVKARRPSARIGACLRVQRFMHDSGYPCPEPLAGPAPLASLSATAERFLAGGSELEEDARRPHRFATALVEFVRTASGFREPADLRPPLPWMGWEHNERGLWPVPDDIDADLNAQAEHPWLDGIGERVRARLLRDSNPRVIGHGDWWGPNLRWADGRLHAVFDWDSLVHLSEPTVAGAASAVYADAWPAVTALDQTQDFIDAYEQARGRPWSEDEREICWASSLWLVAFNAKKQVLQGVTESLEHLRECGALKLSRAGV